MIVRPIKTDKVTPGTQTIYELLDKFLSKLEEESVLVVTSKIVAICEGRVRPAGTTDKEQLIIEESEFYLPPGVGGHGHRTVTRHTLVSGAGIDESNAAGYYVLLPEDSQASANSIREYLKNKFNLNKFGVIITDSVSTPLRLGASGIALGWSGFCALNDYRGEEDLFGREFKVERANIAGGLAAAAVLVMGEGAEQTPLVLIEDIPFVQFQDHNPTSEELEYLNLTFDDDIFAPLINSRLWQKGGRS